MSDRKRYAPWTTKWSKTFLDQMYDEEEVVSGTSIICFPRDNSWFQANISTEDDESIYKLHGRRITDRVLDRNLLSAEGASSSYEPLASSLGSTGSPMDDYRVLHNRGSNEEWYSTILIDFDSGLTHRMNRVKVSRSSPSTCSMTSLQISFHSDKCYKGVRADKIINETMGKTFVEMGITCYEGHIKVSFKDPILPLNTVHQELFI